MPLYTVSADCPITEYEADDEMGAIEQYSENYRVNYKFCSATKCDEPAEEE